MNVGRRVARLRIAHGESLREASLRTGVSHSTIARIEKGEVTSSYGETLRKIADGYRVSLNYILTGRDRKHGKVTATFRKLTPEERAALIFTPGRERLRTAIAMVTRRTSNRLSREQFHTALGVNVADLQRILNGTEGLSPDLKDHLPEVLSNLTGLSPLWFRWSMAEGEVPLAADSEWESYLRLVEKLCRSDLPPDLLEMAIDLLTLNRFSQGEATAANL